MLQIGVNCEILLFWILLRYAERLYYNNNLGESLSSAFQSAPKQILNKCQVTITTTNSSNRPSWRACRKSTLEITKQIVNLNFLASCPTSPLGVPTQNPRSLRSSCSSNRRHEPDIIDSPLSRPETRLEGQNNIYSLPGAEQRQWATPDWPPHWLLEIANTYTAPGDASALVGHWGPSSPQRWCWRSTKNIPLRSHLRTPTWRTIY